jgi:putative ABC transport system permease protein
MGTLWQDIRFGLRMLIKNPGFSFIAILTLGLGIGANTAIFSILNSVLLRPLPFREPERVVQVWTTQPSRSKDRVAASLPDLNDWKEQNTVFEDLATVTFESFNLTGGGEPQRVSAGSVSPNFFNVLGVSAERGRTFVEEEGQRGKHQVIVLSHGIWQRAFGGELSILNSKVEMDGVAYTVVGILPPDFQFVDRQLDLWIPMALLSDTPLRSQRQSRWLPRVLARLKPGFTVEQADQEMRTIASRLEQQYPENEGISARVTTVASELTREVKTSLLVLLGAVGFVLLISCANVASLLLARAVARDREMAVRTAIGASWQRLLKQLLTENIILALLGGGLGLLLGYLAIKAIIAFGPSNIPRLQETSLDGRVLGFTLLASLLTAVVFGLAPAWKTSKTDVHGTLKESGRGSTGSVRGRKMFKALVVLEVAMALLLLVGAGLMIKSFSRLTSIAPGFNASNVMTMLIPLTISRYGTDQLRHNFFNQLIERLEAMPGVESAGATVSQGLPFRSSGWSMPLGIEGRTVDRSDKPVTSFSQVTPGYFEAMGISLLKGRAFTEQDNMQAPKVVVINETLARRYFSNDEPIGKQILLGDDAAGPRHTIVGIVRDVKFRRLDDPFDAAVYSPYYQGFPNVARMMYVVVRTNGDPTRFAGSLRDQVWSLDKDQPVDAITPMEKIVNDSVAAQRFNTILLGIFAAVALVLAAVGIYGIVSYSVTQRTHEIGIRMALGAQKRDIMILVIKQGAVLALIGVGVGLTIALLLTRSLSTVLYEVSATDPVIYSSITVILVSVVLLACLVPARRATRVEPIESLRNE